MRTPTALLAALLLSLSSAALAADPSPTFTARIDGTDVVIDAVSKKQMQCRVWVTFSIDYEGRREQGEHACTSCAVPAGKSEVTRFSNPKMVNPKIEGPVGFRCPPNG
jgi:hypothetical protein